MNEYEAHRESGLARGGPVNLDEDRETDHV
jgi:hypothetical protein